MYLFQCCSCRTCVKQTKKILNQHPTQSSGYCLSDAGNLTKIGRFKKYSKYPYLTNDGNEIHYT